MTKRILLSVGTTLLGALLLCGFSCSTSQQRLAVASDAISHSLVDADAAAKQAVADNVIAQADYDNFHAQLVKVSQAGLVLDQGIRSNASSTTLSGEVNSFLDAFNALNTSGIIGIKDPKTQLAVSTILNGAETSVAIIAAAVGK